MSSVSSPLGTFFSQAFSPPAADQNSRSQRLQPAEQQTPAPVDTVTLSGYFSGLSQLNSPAQPTQPAAASFLASSNALTANPAPAAGATTVVAAQNSTANPAPAATAAPASAVQNSTATPAANLQLAAANQAPTGAGALPPAVQGASSVLNASPAAQQQELAQLDQVLQQLGIDPNSIPLSEQLSMVLYLDDPSALAQLVQSLGQVVETAHLKNLGGNGATQPQNPDQLKGPSTQTAPGAATGANQNLPAAAASQDPATTSPGSPGSPGSAGAPSEIPAAAATPQIAALATAPAVAQAAALAGNAAGAAAVTANQNGPNPAAPATNGFAAQFQELQTSLQALGGYAFSGGAVSQKFSAGGARGRTLNVVA